MFVSRPAGHSMAVSPPKTLHLLLSNDSLKTTSSPETIHANVSQPDKSQYLLYQTDLLHQPIRSFTFRVRFLSTFDLRRPSFLLLLRNT